MLLWKRRMRWRSSDGFVTRITSRESGTRVVGIALLTARTRPSIVTSRPKNVAVLSLVSVHETVRRRQ